MTHHWLAYGNALACVTVDEHKRISEVPPCLAKWTGYPLLALRKHLERMGSVQHGELSGEDLLAVAEREAMQGEGER